MRVPHGNSGPVIPVGPAHGYVTYFCQQQTAIQPLAEVDPRGSVPVPGGGGPPTTAFGRHALQLPRKKIMSLELSPAAGNVYGRRQQSGAETPGPCSVSTEIWVYTGLRKTGRNQRGTFNNRHRDRATDNLDGNNGDRPRMPHTTIPPPLTNPWADLPCELAANGNGFVSRTTTEAGMMAGWVNLPRGRSGWHSSGSPGRGRHLCRRPDDGRRRAGYES